MVASGWDSPGQLTTRFEIAKAIGSGSAGLFEHRRATTRRKAGLPQSPTRCITRRFRHSLSPATRAALDQAGLATGMEHLPARSTRIHAP